MPTPQQIEQALQKVHDQKSFIQELLVGALEWPIPESVERLDDISYDWTKEELRAQDLDEKVVDGKAFQIKLTSDQVWGIFLLEFKSHDALTTGRGLTAPLRKVLRGLVRSRRKASNLASWEREHLLFICTHGYEHYRFAYFKAPAGETKTAPLATFGWSPDEPARTACEFNLPDLVWPDLAAGADEWISQWAGAFDVEKVTKRFYQDYAAEFERLRESISALSGEEQKMFTQTLLNRLMFLRFVERKGWLSPPDGGKPKDYLRLLFAARGYRGKSFYVARLRKLFFEGLAIEGKQESEAIGKVPFLNGGLFDESELDKRVEDIPDSIFKTLLGSDGLFYRYNFTVHESTPLDIEVAVDPEMLGKVFEELVTGRHESGSYYTPRPVVSFMCREAIKGYLIGEMLPASSATSAASSAEQRLVEAKIAAFVDKHEVNSITIQDARKIDEALENIRALDPACGSGAYLLGLLHEIVNLFQLLYSEKLRSGSREIYKIKLDVIEKCLYGVDVDPFATNIAMLRLWLSLTVDSDTPQPLPNLDFKIEVGDSLAGSCDSVGGTLQANLIYKLAEKTVELKDEYLTAHGERKQRLREEIKNYRETIRRELQHHRIADEIDWYAHFTEVFFSPKQARRRHIGFDIILANPPYVRKEEIRPDLKSKLRTQFASAITGRSDLYCSFYARGVQLLREGGMHVFVCSSSWLDAAYGGPLQGFLLRTCHIQEIIDSVVEKQFSTANVNTIISVLRKDRSAEHRVSKFIMLRAPFAAAIGDESKQTRVAVDQSTMLERGKRGTQYVGDKWGGNYLRAPDSYKLIFGEMAKRFVPLGSIASVIGYIHDNNTGGDFPKRAVVWSLRDAREIHVKSDSKAVSLVGVNPSGNSSEWAPILFARTMGTRHLVCWCEPGVHGKEFYRITPHRGISVMSVAAQLNSILGVLQREILGIKGLGGGAIKFAAGDVEQFLILPDLPEAKIIEVFNSLAERPVRDIEDELVQEDRRELDLIILNHLGMTHSDRDRIYNEALNLVVGRREKARSAR